MNYKHILALLFIVANSAVSAQSNLENALNTIAENNKTIIAAKQYVTAKKLENHTGITPDNPFLSADYLIGKTANMGNQFDFSFVQSLEFPSVYFKQSNFADEQDKLLEIGIDELRQDVLLEAKLSIIEIINLNGQKLILMERRDNAQLLVDSYQKKFDLQEINALELNKAKIQLLNTKSDLRNIDSQLKMKNDHLAELNGGRSMTINETSYFLEQDLPDFETLEDTIEFYDPSLKALNQRAELSQSHLELKRAMTLPNFEAGYRYQSVLGQTFNGVHVGISVPLWQHKNEVKSEIAKAEFVKIEIDEHETKHYYEIKEMYENYKNLKTELQEYKAVLEQLNSFEILKKSLEMGQLDFITYSMELNYFYDAKDHLKSIERDYHLAIAKLYKYKL